MGSSMTESAYIVDAVRTAVGRRNGGLASVHPADLGGHVIACLMASIDLDPAAIDDVILGCLDAIGAQAGNVARTSALAAGLPESVPGVTIDRQCGSSQQAVHFAAQAVMSGTMDLVLAGGVQNMSTFPIMSSINAGERFGRDDPWSGSVRWQSRFGTEEVSQFAGADLVAQRWGISRFELEDYALASHRRAIKAQNRGAFDREIAPFGDVEHDEGPRPTTSLEAMAALKPVRPGGSNTAATSSQISDGSAVLLIASERAMRTHGLVPRARICHMAVRGDDPIAMLTAPMSATQWALDRAGMAIDDMDVIEVNEAFASVVLAWQKQFGADPDRVNANGGAIALGHPLGASGARIMTTLLSRLEERHGRYALQTMCEAGGVANVTIVERLDGGMAP
jgi:acetyl-CoA C-acetyltransferase